MIGNPGQKKKHTTVLILTVLNKMPLLPQVNNQEYQTYRPIQSFLKPTKHVHTYTVSQALIKNEDLEEDLFRKSD